MPITYYIQYIHVTLCVSVSGGVRVRVIRLSILKWSSNKSYNLLKLTATLLIYHEILP